MLMDTPFESNLPFLANTSIEDGQIYFEQPNMLQVEDIQDLSQPIFVEIKPLIRMEEGIEDYVDAPARAEPNEISGTAAIFKNGDASPLDPISADHCVHGKVLIPMAAEDGPSFTSDFTTSNPFSLDNSGGEPTTHADKFQQTEEPEQFSHSTISGRQQDEAASTNMVCFDPTAASQYDSSDNPLEQIMSETLLEQSKVTAGPATDPFSIVGDPIRTDVRQDDSIRAVSLGESATAVSPSGIQDDHGMVRVDFLVSEPEPAASQGKNFEEPILNSKGASTGETTISTPASANALVTREVYPVKRRKLMSNVVEISTLSSATTEKYTSLKIEADDKTPELTKSKEEFKHLKSSKAKKDHTFKLDADTVRLRLQQIGVEPFPIALPKSLVDATFQRDMLSHHYGGNMRATFPKIRRAMVAAHGLDDFMYINLQHNPHAPEVPGAPGLWYTVGQAKSITRAYSWTKEQRVLTRLKTGIWQYQGQYALIPADSLTKEEWGAQDVKLRNTWAQEIKTRAWGRPTRARVALRARLGRLPTQAELTAALEAGSKFDEVSSAQIARALMKGEETMAVWAMKCVSYDENFQKELIEKQKTWASPKKAKNGAVRRTKVTKAAPKAGSSKQKAEESDPGGSDDDFVESDNDEIQIISHIKGLAMQRRPRHTR